jgi:hypothetical protein
MSARVAAFFILWTLAWGAESSWQKVKELSAGSEVRVYKKGSRRPVSAKTAGATDDKLLLILKKEEIAIDKAHIDRIDFRPAKSKGVKSESRSTTTDGFGTNDSWSSGMSWSRDGWQTVYRTADQR